MRRSTFLVFLFSVLLLPAATNTALAVNGSVIGSNDLGQGKMRWDLDSNTVTWSVGGGAFPNTVAFNGTDVLHVTGDNGGADLPYNVIDATNGAILSSSTLDGNPGGVNTHLEDLAFTTPTDLWGADLSGSRLVHYDLTTGPPATATTVPVTGFFLSDGSPVFSLIGIASTPLGMFASAGFGSKPPEIGVIDIVTGVYTGLWLETLAPYASFYIHSLAYDSSRMVLWENLSFAQSGDQVLRQRFLTGLSAGPDIVLPAAPVSGRFDGFEHLSGPALPGCGNNVVDLGEQCDGTADQACPGLCRPSGDPNQCRCPICGDNDVNQGTEQCDGSDDSACPGACSALCICPNLPTPTATATPLPPLNHFHCYEVHAPNNIISGISLADQFGSSTVQLIEPRRFCAPANKNDEDPTAVTDPDHLAGYRLRQTTPKFNRIRGYFADNQFGTTSIDILRPEYLMAPSAKSLAAPPPPPLANPVTDHFKCYRVSGRKSVRGVKVQDQFGTQTVDLKRPRRLCVPADKNGEGILDAETHLLCYQVRRASGFTQPPGTIFINNQFGQDEFELFRPTELCVPSLKRGPGSTPRPSATRTLTPIATPTLTVAPSETPTPVATATDVATSTPVATTTPEPTLTAVLATSTPEPTLTAVLATSTPEPTLTAVLATSTPEPTLTAVLATSTPEPTLTPVLATSTPEPTLTPPDDATSTPEPTLTPPDDATSTPTPAPTPISCSFDQNEQSCANDCPPGFECSQTGPNIDDCFCVQLPPCGLDAGTCGGSCPNVGDLCLFVTDVAACACVPPSSACEAATIPTCNGFCPNVADPCVPGNIDPSVCACGGVQ